MTWGQYLSLCLVASFAVYCAWRLFVAVSDWLNKDNDKRPEG